MTWVGVIDGDIIGPYFIEDNVTAESYLRLLGDFLIPELYARGYDPNNIWYQHDGAPAHTAYLIQDWLNDTFPNLIGKGGTIPWPARSPDLNPLDIFVWNQMKNYIYSTKPASLEELQERIMNSTNSINAGMLHRTYRNLEERMLMCQLAGGGHFEQFM